MDERFFASSNVSFTQSTIMSLLAFCPLPISSRIFSVYLLSCSANLYCCVWSLVPSLLLGLWPHLLRPAEGRSGALKWSVGGGRLHSWAFQTVSWEVSGWDPDGTCAELCGYMAGRQVQAPCEFSPCHLGKEKSARSQLSGKES